jgi:FHS family glucose/mannose:H+ symporter-like MFS transporter
MAGRARDARLLAVTACTLNVVTGAAQAYYGPAIPAMRGQFSITVATAGLAFGAFFLGALLGIVGWGVFEHRVSRRALVVLADVLVAVGCTGVAFADAWILALLTTLSIGLGAGILLVGYNSAFAVTFGSRAPLMLNVLHACASTGFVLGPIIISVMPAGNFRPAFLANGLLAILLLPVILIGPNITAHNAAPAPRAPQRARGPLLAFMGLFALYVGVEVGASGWMATHLAAIGWSVPEAARWTAVFSGTFTAGRLLAAGPSIRIRRDRLVTWALACAVVVLLAATWSSAAPLAYAVTGLALAPVYGTGVAWLTQELPAIRSSTALVLATGTIGGVTIPPLIGRIIDVTAPDLVPVLLAAIATAATAVAVTLRRLTSHSDLASPDVQPAHARGP